MQVSQAISIGPRCMTAYQVRRYFGHGETWPFDWWITPLDGLLAILERFDPEWIFDADNLEVVDGGYCVMHTPTGVRLNHEFPRVGQDGPIVKHWREHIATRLHRAEYIFDKFRRLDDPNETILFVREGAISLQVMAAMQKLLPRAARIYDCLPIARTPFPGEKWSGDDTRWSSVLSVTGHTLSNPDIKPFAQLSP